MAGDSSLFHVVDGGHQVILREYVTRGFRVQQLFNGFRVAVDNGDSDFKHALIHASFNIPVNDLIQTSRYLLALIYPVRIQ